MALPNMTEISTAIRGLMPQLRPTPVGLIGYFHDIPDGWLLCNGAAVSRTTYSKLFNIIGTRYGAGDGSTTFNLPNLDGRFLESTTDVSKLGQYVEAGLPDISGYLSYITASGSMSEASTSGALSYLSEISARTVRTDGTGADSITFDAKKCSSIYGASATVQTASLRMLPCIKS